MASSSSSKLLFLFSFWFCLLFLPQITTSVENYCPPSYCGDNNVPVRFPFQLKNRPTSFSARCVYPGFELSCFNNQTILNLPNSGPFTVQIIDYMTQSLLITDPENCLPNRLLQGFSLEGSPFNTEVTEPNYLLSFTFLNCSSSATTLTEHDEYYRIVSCLSGQNYTVLAGPAEIYYNESTLPSSCVKVSTVQIPWRSLRSGIQDGLELVWSRPSCGNCEELRRACGFKNSEGLETGCSSFPRLAGISRDTKYSIVLAVGIPALCCMIGLACYLCSRIRATGERHRRINTALSTSSIALTPSIILTGLDGPTIESYPKTLLGESKRLPKPNDNTCSICLCEYEAKETLRTIPECNHYFHADCIDEWLKMKASCPMCRNSPNESTSTSSSSRPSISSSWT